MTLQNALGNLALDASIGTDGTSPPAMGGGATGVRGWLRLIWSVLTGTLQTKDDYQATICVADVAGNNASQNIPFGATVNLVVIECTGGTGRADVSGTPTASKGFRCDDGVPTYLPVIAASVNVYATSGTTITVNGFQRA